MDAPRGITGVLGASTLCAATEAPTLRGGASATPRGSPAGPFLGDSGGVGGRAVRCPLLGSLTSGEGGASEALAVDVHDPSAGNLEDGGVVSFA